MIYRFYRTLTFLAGPLLPVVLRMRLRNGKEEAQRLGERLGVAGAERPKGKLLWLHAASMGESLSALPLINAFLKQNPDWHLLLTTVTVTSARVMAKSLPVQAFHQFAPLDHPAAVDRFLRHWKPDMTLWVESELWPNMALHTRKTGCPMFLINARMSARSCERWQVVPALAEQVVGCFDAIYAQSHDDVTRFESLGAKRVEYLGNLKYGATPLGCDVVMLEELKAQLGNRPRWLAASTHDGEESIAASVHHALHEHYDNLLTVIVPRHANRGDELAAMLRAQGLDVAQRSKQEPITDGTDIYLADTMGELGLFYRLCPLAFIGGSLVPHGGQNMLEAARLGCVILTGPHTRNFTAICNELELEHALLRVNDALSLEEMLRRLLTDRRYAELQSQAARIAVNRHEGVVDALLTRITDFSSRAAEAA